MANDESSPPAPPVFFPVSEMPVHPYGGGVRAFRAVISGAAASEFWGRSGDPNVMHDPARLGGMLQGVALIYIANAAVAMAYPDYVLGGLNCGLGSPVLVSLRRDTEVHVILGVLETVDDGLPRLSVEVHGPLRPGGAQFLPVITGHANLYKRSR